MGLRRNGFAMMAAAVALLGCSGDDPGGSGDSAPSGSGSNGNGSSGNGSNGAGTGSGMTTGTGAGNGTGSGVTTGGGTETGSPTGSPNCDGIVQEGFTEGQIAQDWSLPDNVMAMVNLYASCGKVIFFEEGSMW